MLQANQQIIFEMMCARIQSWIFIRVHKDESSVQCRKNVSGTRAAMRIGYRLSNRIENISNAYYACKIQYICALLSTTPFEIEC